jgi:hypothetical protein
MTRNDRGVPAVSEAMKDRPMHQFNFRSRKVETLAFRRDFARQKVDYDPENLWDPSWGELL